MGGHIKYNGRYAPIYRIVEYDYKTEDLSEVVSVVSTQRPGTETYAGRRGFTKIGSRSSTNGDRIHSFACDERIEKSFGSSVGD